MPLFFRRVVNEPPEDHPQKAGPARHVERHRPAPVLEHPGDRDGTDHRADIILPGRRLSVEADAVCVRQPAAPQEAASAGPAVWEETGIYKHRVPSASEL